MHTTHTLHCLSRFSCIAHVCSDVVMTRRSMPSAISSLVDTTISGVPLLSPPLHLSSCRRHQWWVAPLLLHRSRAHHFCLTPSPIAPSPSPLKSPFRQSHTHTRAMRLLHKCDLFRVVQDSESHLTPATPYGAAVSIATTIVLVILFMCECHAYVHGHRNCHVAPSTFTNTLDADAQRTVDRLHFSISLAYIPCHRLATETVSGFVHDEQTERDTHVSLYHIPYGSYTSSSSTAYTPGEALSEREKGCLVTGTAPIAAKPSSFNIILNNYKVEDSTKYRPDFQIHHFSGGNSYSDWGVPQIGHRTLEPMSGFKTAIGLRDPYFFQFFLEFIPTTVDLGGTDSRLGYQHTAFYSTLRYNGMGRAPGLYFSYKRSSFSMDCAVQYDTMSHFLVNLCAVVGGVYSVAEMVEGGLEWLARERRLREVSARNRSSAEAVRNAAGGVLDSP
ncbi:hypothetical protein, conserved [Leishmania tarentolae]|uniref:Endoplasmic reticulum vesicle transporter C-terminal domain-containing protein n=1 Tax=Leishmania tarentolae TaxID=5689 RepID=A0A640KU11_LEITA|nr:hypothetical protein, conserved [Leishmania tarentolae]